MVGPWCYAAMMSITLRVLVIASGLVLLGCGAGTTGESQYGDAYDAYSNAGGPRCGSGSSGGEVFCKAGDHCTGLDSTKCQTVLSGAYDAYPEAGGPLCGDGPHGGSVHCEAGDTCQGQSAASCSTSADGSYDAYPDAGGPLCGSGPNGGTVYCKAGGSCLSDGHCK